MARTFHEVKAIYACKLTSKIDALGNYKFASGASRDEVILKEKEFWIARNELYRQLGFGRALLFELGHMLKI